MAHIRLFDVAVHALLYGLAGKQLWGGTAGRALQDGITTDPNVEKPHAERLFRAVCNMAKALGASAKVPKYIYDCTKHLQVSYLAVYT